MTRRPSFRRAIVVLLTILFAAVLTVVGLWATLRTTFTIEDLTVDELQDLAAAQAYLDWTCSLCQLRGAWIVQDDHPEWVPADRLAAVGGNATVTTVAYRGPVHYYLVIALDRVGRIRGAEVSFWPSWPLCGGGLGGIECYLARCQSNPGRCPPLNLIRAGISPHASE